MMRVSVSVSGLGLSRNCAPQSRPCFVCIRLLSGVRCTVELTSDQTWLTVRRRHRIPFECGRRRYRPAATTVSCSQRFATLSEVAVDQTGPRRRGPTLHSPQLAVWCVAPLHISRLRAGYGRTFHFVPSPCLPGSPRRVGQSIVFWRCQSTDAVAAMDTGILRR